MRLTRRQTDQVVVTLGGVWDSSLCERDPAEMWRQITAALEANTAPGEISTPEGDE